ncbi:MAG: hypothetical protein ABSF62_13000 [Bryobacteraceae bacterium]
MSFSPYEPRHFAVTFYIGQDGHLAFRSAANDGSPPRDNQTEVTVGQGDYVTWCIGTNFKTHQPITGVSIDVEGCDSNSVEANSPFNGSAYTWSWTHGAYPDTPLCASPAKPAASSYLGVAVVLADGSVLTGKLVIEVTARPPVPTTCQVS